MSFSRCFVRLIFIGISSSVSYAQQRIVLIPDYICGKDALIISERSDENFDQYEAITASAITFNSVPYIYRSLIEFDLSQIPKDATIQSAYLNLYAYYYTGHVSHNTSGGSNECVLQRIIEPWDENTVTWGNQPKTAQEGEVVLLESIKPVESYSDIDISEFVQDMVRNPETNHGMMMKLVKEEFYRRMFFASSDHMDFNLRPKLEITFNSENSLLGNDTVICYGDSLVLGDRIGDGKCTWQDGSENKYYTVKSAGLYSVAYETCLGIMYDSIYVEFE